MSDDNDYESDEWTRRLKFIDLNDPNIGISLPAEGPAGHLHFIDVSTFDSGFPSDRLNAADAVATTLYKWKPEALEKLLDLTKEDFRWGHLNSHGYELYVDREGDRVLIGSKNLLDSYPDFEIRYVIGVDGKWRLKGAQHSTQWCKDYDRMAAVHLISNELWERTDQATFHFDDEIFYSKDRKDTGGDSDDDDKPKCEAGTKIKQEVTTSSDDKRFMEDDHVKVEHEPKKIKTEHVIEDEDQIKMEVDENKVKIQEEGDSLK